MPFKELWSSLTDGRKFLHSCLFFKEHVGAPLIIASLAGIFTVIAGFDYINGSKYGYGNKYTEAWETMAPMAVSMVGITSLTPVFRIALTPFIAPIFGIMQSHQAMFAGAILDPAMGGYPLAVKLAPESYPIAMYSVILGSMLGATICFNIPVGLSMIRPNHHIFFAYGTLVGILSVPFGTVIGGLIMSAGPFAIPLADVFKNLIPIFVITVLLSVSLYFFPFGTLRGFMHFSGAITFLMTFGALLAIFEEMTKIEFPLWSTMVDDDGENVLMTILAVVAEIAMVLTGTIPLVHFIISMVGPFMGRAARKIGLTEIDAGGLVASLPSALPMFGMFDDMSYKGMVFNAAFEVGAAYALGDHLAYLGSVEPELIVPLIIGKMLGALIALVMCIFIGDFFVKKGLEALGETASAAGQEPEVRHRLSHDGRHGSGSEMELEGELLDCAAETSM
jgi:ethanolamine transporter